MAIAPARTAAYKILLAVETEERHADDLLHGAALQRLTPRDRALATNLVMGTLRWQLALDASTQPLLRAGTVLAPPVAIALRMGLLQLWYMDRIPAHAALSESVELVKANGYQGMAGVVNAILRKLTRQPKPADSKAAVLAHPAWMVDRWRLVYGDHAAQKICEAGQQLPPTVLRLRGDAPAGTVPASLLSNAALLERTSDDDADDNAINRLRMQDEGSQLVAEIAAAAAPNALRVLDACAAPGGKTAILAEMLPNAAIVAADSSRTRLSTMQRLMPSDLAQRIEYVQADAAHPQATPALLRQFDLVLCDVPCSGTGTLARNPEIRLTLHASQLARYAHKQLHILEACWKQLAAGGTLVYSTCSLEPEENARVLGRFLANAQSATVLPMAPLLEAMRQHGRITESGAALLQATALQGSYLRTVPGAHPCDGFFVSAMQRR